MRFKKPSKKLTDAFADAVPRDRSVRRRMMFGMPCVFVQGQMFAGLHEERLVVRLSEPDRRELLAIPGARRFEPLPGRVMREYVVVPPRILADADLLRAWVARALAFARTLPPKRSPAVVRQAAARAAAKTRGKPARKAAARDKPSGRKPPRPAAAKKRPRKQAVARKPTRRR